MMSPKGRLFAFSLVELVVVVVIIGILAAIAIPRLSRGSSGASESAVAADLSMIRGSISMYAAEHKSNFPGAKTDGTNAANTAEAFIAQLTQYTDINGNAQQTKDTTHVYGPYIVSMPPCPVGEAAGTTTAADVLIDTTNSPPTVVTTNGEGWVYNPSTGEFLPNTTTSDESGTAFNLY